MDTDLLGYVQARLKATNGQWRRIADEADVPYDTLTKIALGRTPNPRIGTVQKLANYFQRAPA